jgi:hypothetical protein
MLDPMPVSHAGTPAKSDYGKEKTEQSQDLHLVTLQCG